MKNTFGRRARNSLPFFGRTLFGFSQAWQWRRAVLSVRAIARTPFAKASFPLMRLQSFDPLVAILTLLLTNIGY